MNRLLTHLRKSCQYVDEVIMVLAFLFISGLFFHIHSQNGRIHELVRENAELVGTYTEHINDLKAEVQFANEKAQARAERIEKLDNTMSVLKHTVETLQTTIEEQHNRIQFMLNNPSRGKR